MYRKLRGSNEKLEEICSVQVTIHFLTSLLNYYLYFNKDSVKIDVRIQFISFYSSESGLEYKQLSLDCDK